METNSVLTQTTHTPFNVMLLAGLLQLKQQGKSARVHHSPLNKDLSKKRKWTPKMKMSQKQGN